MKVDLAWWIYFFIFAFSVSGGVLSVILWSRTEIRGYAYLALFAFGVAFSTFGSVYVRWFKFTAPDKWHEFMGTWLWANRLWPELIAAVVVAIHGAVEVFRTR